MVKYSRTALVPEKSVKAMGCDLRTSFKNTYNVAQAIKGWKLEDAKKYLNDVLLHKRCIPFQRFKSGVSRNAQVKEFKQTTQGRWPSKSAKIVLSLLQNAESNADHTNLESKNLVVSHIQVQRATPGRRRTYRAHGRINAYASQPCHIEMILAEEDSQNVQKPEGDKPKRFTKTQIARRNLTAAN